MERNYVTVTLCIDAAGIVCGAGSMKRSGVRLSVCLSVCPVIRPQQQRRHSTALSSKCEQCHVDS